tara:strand:- start:7253 stop:7432 length:180 start_codon:yes stop_codon:yes gene_type:complete
MRIRPTFANIDWKRTFKMALVIIPVLAWDLFYYLLCRFKDLCDKIDEVGGNFFENYVRR